MSLMQKALDTYNSYEHKIGVIEEGKEPLAPVGHIIGTAKIQIKIDKEGNFKEATTFKTKENKEKSIPKKIIIPVTEQSAGRSGKKLPPHPLCEQIKYLSGQDEEKYNLYISQLEKWVSECPNEKLEAVLRYVKGRTIIDDLTNAGLYKDDKDLVGWVVVGAEDSGIVWADKDLFDLWTNYYKKKHSSENNQVLSMISGNYGCAANQHIKGVVSSAGNSKIISTNDKGELKYRGERFLNAKEALTISYEDSQKAHNALRWVIANNGVHIGDHKRSRVFVCWDPNGKEISTNNLFDNNPLIDKNLSDYNQNLDEAVYKSKDSFKNDQNYENGELVIAAFESTSDGRLAVTYYRELSSSDFISRTKEWNNSCCWPKILKGGIISEVSPDIRTIVKFAFGTERNEKIEISGKVYGMHVQRLLSCRLDGTPFPRDIVTALVRNVSSPQRYSSKNWRTLLHITCAVIKKYNYDKYKEECNMLGKTLEPDKMDRDYQYGRLLAVLEKAEKDTYSEDDRRETNVARMWTAFKRNPRHVDTIIYGKLKNAYYKKLNNRWPKRSDFYDKLINEIREKIALCEKSDHSTSLGDNYLQGYSLQMNALYTKNEENGNNAENNNQ